MSSVHEVEDSHREPPPSATSRTLLSRVQADDPEAWDRLVTLYAPLVHHWCRASGLQCQDADDVFQEVFRAVVAHVGGFRKQRSGDTFRGWLRRITQNKLRDHFRKLGSDPRGAGGSSARERLAQIPQPAPLDPVLPPDDEQAERGLFARALELIRGEFEERTWSAFWGTTVDARETKDVAADLAMSPGAVRVAKSRVLHRLREALGDLPE
jgi:RNA polymerase sigma-70 factor (ECF subfamily)